MRKPWKALVERADGAAYSHAEVVACVGPAVSSDWNCEVSSEYLAEVGQFLGCGKQVQLFEKDPAEIDRLRQRAASPMEALLADYAKDACECPLQGGEALQDVIDKTMRESAVRRMLQAQEHYERNSSGVRATHMKSRLQKAVIASAPTFSVMAQAIVSGSRIVSRAPSRHEGLDDGPPLP